MNQYSRDAESMHQWNSASSSARAITVRTDQCPCTAEGRHIPEGQMLEMSEHAEIIEIRGCRRGAELRIAQQMSVIGTCFSRSLK